MRGFHIQTFWFLGSVGLALFNFGDFHTHIIAFHIAENDGMKNNQEGTKL